MGGRRCCNSGIFWNFGVFWLLLSAAQFSFNRTMSIAHDGKRCSKRLRAVPDDSSCPMKATKTNPTKEGPHTSNHSDKRQVWCEADVSRLKELVAKYSTEIDCADCQWDEVAVELGVGRSGDACRKRWKQAGTCVQMRS